MPRAELKRVVGDPKRFTAYEFVERIEKRTSMKYSEPHARHLLRSLGSSDKKVSEIADRVLPRRGLGIWQKDTKKEVEAFENDDFTCMMAESRQNSNIFGSGAVYRRGDTEPVPTQPGSQRQTVYGDVTLDGQTRFMMAKKANGRSLIIIWTSCCAASACPPPSLTI